MTSTWRVAHKTRLLGHVTVMTSISKQQATARRLVRDHGQTFAEEAGITVRDKPAPLWRLLVLALLLSARIDSGIAIKATRELGRAGCRTPRRMLQSTWQDRVDALGRGGYRRYDERTATQLAEAAELVIDRRRGDLRRLHVEAGSDVVRTEKLLQEVNGIGPAGAAIFIREAQAVWTDLRPYADSLVLDGARVAGLQTSEEGLGDLVPPQDVHRLVAACVRVAKDRDLLES